MNLISKDIFSRLMTTSGNKNLNNLSKELGYTESWGASTKKRNGIPYEACAQISEKHNVSMDYLLYGIENKRQEIGIDLNELKFSVAEGVFRLIQMKMIEANEGVKISIIADAITNEIKSHFDIIDTKIKKGDTGVFLMVL